MFTTSDRTPLPRDFFDRPVLDVAPDLLGRLLVRTTPEGPITLRDDVMFGMSRRSA